jgi:hypothetical protein
MPLHPDAEAVGQAEIKQHAVSGNIGMLHRRVLSAAHPLATAALLTESGRAAAAEVQVVFDEEQMPRRAIVTSQTQCQLKGTDAFASTPAASG